MRPLTTDAAWSVCLRVCVCVCLLDRTLTPTKTDKPIEMLFGVWTQVGPMNVVLGGGPNPPTGTGNFGGCSPLKCIRLCYNSTPMDKWIDR